MMLLLLLVIYDQQHRQQQHLNIYDVVVVVGNIRPTTPTTKPSQKTYQHGGETCFTSIVPPVLTT